MKCLKMRRVIGILLLAVVTGVLFEFLQIKTQPAFTIREYRAHEGAVALSLQDAEFLNNVEVSDSLYTPVGPDPYILMDTSSVEKVSSVLLALSEPADVATRYQVFYADEENAFSEGSSVWVSLNVGQKVSAIDIPEGRYKSIRIDIDQQLPIEKIEFSEQKSIIVSETERAENMHWRRAVLVSAIAFIIYCIAYIYNWIGNMYGQMRKLFKEVAEKKAHTGKCILAFVGIAAVTGAIVYLMLKVKGYIQTVPLVVFSSMSGITVGLMAVCRRTLRDKAEYIFLYIALSAGLMLVFGMQFNTRNSWDEEFHFRSMLNVSYVSEMRFTEADNALLTNMMTQAAPLRDYEHIANAEEQYDVMYDNGAALVEPERINIKEVSAVPGGLLMYLGRVFGANYHLIVRLGRLGNLLTYAIAGFFAIKRLRSGKMIFTVILLGVTNVLLASSFSYDAFVNAFTALAFAYYFAQWQEKDQCMEWKDALVMVFALGIGTLPKAIYVSLMPILLWLPKEKFKSKRDRNIYRMLVIGVILFVAATFVLPFLTDMGSKSDTRGGSDVNAAEQVKFILSDPIGYAKILLNFIGFYISIPQSESCFNHMAYLGMAGYHSIYILVAAVAMFTDKNRYDKFLVGQNVFRAYAHILLFATICLFSTALYVSFTPVGYHTVLGCQQRYLIPVLFPAMYLLGSGKIQNDMDRGWYNFVIFAGVTFVLYNGIWINVLGRLA